MSNATETSIERAAAQANSIAQAEVNIMVDNPVALDSLIERAGMEESQYLDDDGYHEMAVEGVETGV